MDKKTTGIVAYITLIGWLIAFLAGDKEGAKFHLNQALVIMLSSIISGIISGIIGFIPIIGAIISLVLGVFIFVCWIMGLVAACQGVEKEVPLIGKIKILK
jgi:uncharacterized membrane protein